MSANPRIVESLRTCMDSWPKDIPKPASLVGVEILAHLGAAEIEEQRKVIEVLAKAVICPDLFWGDPPKDLKNTGGLHHDVVEWAYLEVKNAK